MRLYDTTTDNRTYKLLRIRALGLGPFYYESLHRPERYYHYKIDRKKRPEGKKIPNWKLCTKNKKQWQPKNLIRVKNLRQSWYQLDYIIDDTIYWEGHPYTSSFRYY